MRSGSVPKRLDWLISNDGAVLVPLGADSAPDTIDRPERSIQRDFATPSGCPVFISAWDQKKLNEVKNCGRGEMQGRRPFARVQI